MSEWEPDAMRWQPITFEQLMYRLSHCDDCDCEHGNPHARCACICHREQEWYAR